MTYIKSRSSLGLWSTISFFLFVIMYSALTVIFFKEKLVGDASYSIVRLLHQKELFYYVGRFASPFLRDLPTLINIKLGMSLKPVILTYLLTFPATVLIVGLILIAWKQKDLLIVLIAILGVGASRVFFWPTEMELVIVLSVLQLGLLRRSPDHQIPLSLHIQMVSLSLLKLFIHPISPIIDLCIVGLYYAYKRRLHGALIYFSVIFISYIIFKNLDIDSLESQRSTIQWAAFSLPNLKALIEFIIVNYFPINVIFVGFFIYQFLQKQYLFCLCAVALTFFYLLIVNMTHPFGKHTTIYMEHMNQGLLLIWGAFIALTLFKIKTWWLRALMPIILVISSFVSILMVSSLFSKRVHLIENLIQTLPKTHNAYLIDVYSYDFSHRLLFTSHTKTQSNLLSALISPQNPMVIMVKQNQLFKLRFPSTYDNHLYMTNLKEFKEPEASY